MFVTVMPTILQGYAAFLMITELRCGVADYKVAFKNEYRIQPLSLQTR